MAEKIRLFFAACKKAALEKSVLKLSRPANETYSMDDFTVEIKPYTKAHMDLFRSMVGRIGKEDNYDTFFSDIIKIIDEETKAFFVKPAQEFPCTFFITAFF